MKHSMRKQKPRIPKQLSRESADAFLRGAEYRVEPSTVPEHSDAMFVRFLGEWWELCHTDLKDDVCTDGRGWWVADGRREVDRKRFTPKEWALSRNRFGVRFKLFEYGGKPVRLCAVIDQYSDG